MWLALHVFSLKCVHKVYFACICKFCACVELQHWMIWMRTRWRGYLARFFMVTSGTAWTTSQCSVWCALFCGVVHLVSASLLCVLTCAAVMGEMYCCCRELVEMCWTRKLVPETLDTRKRMERLLQVFTRLDENGKRYVHVFNQFFCSFVHFC